MNVNPLVRDIGRIIMSLLVVGAWLYCEISHDICAEVFRPYALAVIAAWLGIEGVLKIVEGVQTGKYTKEADL